MKLRIKVGFIGFGKMGSALAKGAVRAGVCRSSQIVAFDSVGSAKRMARGNRFQVAKDLSGLIKKTDLIFICVKPQQMNGLYKQIKKFPKNLSLKKKCFVSIAAGTPLKSLQRGLGAGVPLIRVMPNTPALLNAGMSALSRGRFAKSSHVAWAKSLLASVGQVVQVSESKMDAVTAVSGSGPAYSFYLAEGMIRGAKKVGLNARLAEQLVHQTVMGSGLMLSRLKDSAETLRKAVTSPGGTTAAALKEFDKRKLHRIIEKAIRSATKRSKQLSKI